MQGWEDRVGNSRLLRRIEEIRKALDEEEDPEEASRLALLLRSLEEEVVQLGSAESPETLF